MSGIDYSEIDYIEVDELDFRLGLTQLLIANNRLDYSTNRLIERVIQETRHRAITEALHTYIKEAQNMSTKDLLNEEHRSKRLSDFLTCQGYVRPGDNFEAHALVSGGHPRAAIAREIIAQFKIRIDEPANGLWLPNFKRNLYHNPTYKHAHRTIHRKIYYLNITSCLEQAMNPIHARAILRRIAQGLVTGEFPIDRRLRMKEVMIFAKGI
ncbi:AHH domain-containing protein [Microbulbifer thermotolerans]|uniref:AHH domain-containing protein n=1 Tax=Microbulbifer thermotolerans TaxID=252514 RepID=UPI00224B304F|nr:AHH domain-containing protein [Microbulbifer thermotolerans]MCX2841691.1 AHH domain-containing protein [Microbulbifer thermotolerans]WKT59848.1 AHH domain-containing protein [Microbulbifer thermotolerans]